MDEKNQNTCVSVNSAAGLKNSVLIHFRKILHFNDYEILLCIIMQLCEVADTNSYFEIQLKTLNITSCVFITWKRNVCSKRS